jgi:hypothetical protein
MLPTQILESYPWLALSSLVLGLVVRALKADTKLPINVKPEWRPHLAFGLGAVAGVLELVVAGHTWQQAVATTILAPLAAILGHELIIEGARKGVEVPLPGLMRGKK